MANRYLRTTGTLIWASVLTRESSLAFQISRKARLLGTKTKIHETHETNEILILNETHETTNSISNKNPLSEQDIEFLDLAVDCAKKGIGYTFPNPAVGCVLVNQQSNQVIGSGFHPQAGFPHAEIFALFQASNNLSEGSTGVDAALSIAKNPDNQKTQEVIELTNAYLAQNGPQNLFQDSFSDIPVTAYVTLEPCCHTGKRTPPCTLSLSIAKVNRVVIGYQDPNPQVDGGGVQVLKEAGIQVDLAQSKDCELLVQNFVRRMTLDFDESIMTGSMRRALRSLAGRKKAAGTLSQMESPECKDKIKIDDEEAIQSIQLSPSWMEHLDDQLWKHELVLLRLNKAVAKKKAAKILGQRIATDLNAHVAQVVGHTALLYRPSIPPILDLEAHAEGSNIDSTT